MNQQRKKLIARTVIWLAAEVVLSSIGLDNLADYSEYIFEKNHPVLLG